MDDMHVFFWELSASGHAPDEVAARLRAFVCTTVAREPQAQTAAKELFGDERHRVDSCVVTYVRMLGVLYGPDARNYLRCMHSLSPDANICGAHSGIRSTLERALQYISTFYTRTLLRRTRRVLETVYMYYKQCVLNTGRVMYGYCYSLRTHETQRVFDARLVCNQAAAMEHAVGLVAVFLRDFFAAWVVACTHVPRPVQALERVLDRVPGPWRFVAGAGRVEAALARAVRPRLFFRVSVATLNKTFDGVHAAQLSAPVDNVPCVACLQNTPHTHDIIVQTVFYSYLQRHAPYIYGDADAFAEGVYVPLLNMVSEDDTQDTCSA